MSAATSSRQRREEEAERSSGELRRGLLLRMWWGVEEDLQTGSSGERWRRRWEVAAVRVGEEEAVAQVERGEVRGVPQIATSGFIFRSSRGLSKEMGMCLEHPLEVFLDEQFTILTHFEF
jgi:hypothetical protein